MKTYRHIIWDWNGTVWDDTWLCVEINNHMLRRRNLPPITLEIYRQKLCFPVSNYYCQLGFDYAQDPYNTLAEEFIAEYETRRFECELHRGARELIEFLTARQIPQAVLSAYHQDKLVEAVDYFRLTPHFREVIGLNDIYAAGKVENGRQYMTGLDIRPEEALFIGDTVHDYEVAREMGIDCVLVANGHNTRSRLASCGVPVFDSLAEIETSFREVCT